MHAELNLTLKLADAPCSRLYKTAICHDLAVRDLFAASAMH